jgi:hypothetical protein
MNFKNILIEELDTNTIVCDLNESWFLTTPFIAFTTFKRKAFNALNKSKMFSSIKKSKEDNILGKAKATALIQKEKIRHDTGIRGKGDEETVYKLTPEQLKIMAEIYKKHGKKIIEEIQLFRRNILAPYQLIKRLVKKNKTVTAKEVNGLTYDEYKAAVESGRRKILRRGETIGKVGEKHGKIDEYNDLIQKLQTIKNSFGEGDSSVINSLMDKVYEKFNVSSNDLYGFKPDELKIITDEIASSFGKVKYFLMHPQSKELPPEDVLRTITKNIALRAGDVSNEHVQEILRAMSKEGIKSSELNSAISKYLLRKEIRSKIRSADRNAYKEYYKSLIDEMLSKTLVRRKQMVGSAALDRSYVDFNDREEKVWGLLPTKKAKYTGDVGDYYLKIKEDEFKNVEHIQKPEGVENAQRAIENEIKRFERKLVKIIGPEDLAKLKQYRLINNLITVKELKDAGSLFKSEDELNYEEEQDDDAEPQDNEEEQDDGEVSEEDFVSQLKDYDSEEIGSLAELNTIKKSVDELIIKMRKQGDNDIIEKHRDLINKIRTKKGVDDKETPNYEDVNTVGDIKRFAIEILKKKYRDADEMEQDNGKFNEMISEYKKNEPNAEKGLKEIEYVLKQVENKLGQSE